MPNPTWPGNKEFTAQCWGGPEHGNLVSAAVKRWQYTQTTHMFLNEDIRQPVRKIVSGKYEYDHNLDGNRPLWIWAGPGTDGATMERMRKA